MKSSRSRLTFDLALVAAMVVVSFFSPQGGSALRILAGIYTLFAVLANTLVGNRARLVLDVTFALFVASMAWYELIPTGYQAAAVAIYAALGGIVAGYAINRNADVLAG